ncbi:MAG: hypothetical protein M1503_11165 [Thaumarchaeota archaeon]|nr:hypothetical protein [Nitrososphaerota archaeon]
MIRILLLAAKVKCDVCGKLVSNLAKHKRRGRCKAAKRSSASFDQVLKNQERKRFGGQLGPDYS